MLVSYIIYKLQFKILKWHSVKSVQSLSWAQLFGTPWTAACQGSLSITNSREFTQAHSHWVGDAIQLSHPLSSLSLPALNLSQHQGLFKHLNSLHQVAKVLEFQLQHQSFQCTLMPDLQDVLVASPCSPRDSQESSPIPPFKSINSLALSLPYSPTLTTIHDYSKNHSFE